MTELTTYQMADINGTSFWMGFLCGAGIIILDRHIGLPGPRCEVDHLQRHRRCLRTSVLLSWSGWA